jgi:hypothetical protein
MGTFEEAARPHRAQGRLLLVVVEVLVLEVPVVVEVIIEVRVAVTKQHARPHPSQHAPP